MDRSVTSKMVYGHQLRFGPYNNLGVTDRSINYHMTLTAMHYLLNIIKVKDETVSPKHTNIIHIYIKLKDI